MPHRDPREEANFMERYEGKFMYRRRHRAPRNECYGKIPLVKRASARKVPLGVLELFSPVDVEI